MKTTNLLLAAILIALVAVIAMQLRAAPATPKAATVGGSAPLAPPVAQTPVQSATAAGAATASADAQTLLAAAAVIERRGGDQSARTLLLRSLRRIDEAAFFAEVARLGRSGSMNDLRMILQDDGEGTADRRFLPLLRQVADRMLAGGEQSSYELVRIAALIQRIDAVAAAPYVDEAVRRMISRNDGRLDGDNAMQRLVLASGVPMAHALLLRGMRLNEYGNQGREQTYLQLCDLYAGVRRLPLLPFDRRDQKWSDEERKLLLDEEQWMIAQRHLLLLDRSTGRMVLAKDEAEAVQLRAKLQPAKPETAAPEPGNAF